MTDLEKAKAVLMECLSKCFLDVELTDDGESRQVLYNTPKGEVAKGSIRIGVGTSKLLFTNRRTLSGINAKALTRYVLRGPSTIEPQWSVAKLMDNITSQWSLIDKDYSSVIFFSEGDLWTTVQCIVKDDDAVEKVLTFSFNTTIPAPVKEVKKKKKEDAAA